LTAKTHGLDEEAQNILAAAGMTEDQLTLPGGGGQLLKPPTPIYKQFDNNWPLLMVSKGIFEGSLFNDDNRLAAAATLDDDAMMDAAGGWGDDLDIPELGGPPKPVAIVSGGAMASPADVDDEEGGGWDLDAELQLPDDLGEPGAATAVAAPSGTLFAAPTPGTAINEFWVRNSGLAVDHAAAGSYDTAMQLLNRQIGAVNFAPLKPAFIAIYQSAHTYMSAIPSTPSLTFNIHRTNEDDPRRFLPVVTYNMQSVIAKLQEAYGATTAGKFNEALNLFRQILHMVVFTVATKKAELEEVRIIIVCCAASCVLTPPLSIRLPNSLASHESTFWVFEWKWPGRSFRSTTRTRPSGRSNWQHTSRTANFSPRICSSVSGPP
jgi:coatomer protein complex subunit alpha (xenin)